MPPLTWGNRMKRGILTEGWPGPGESAALCHLKGSWLLQPWLVLCFASTRKTVPSAATSCFRLRCTFEAFEPAAPRSQPHGWAAWGWFPLPGRPREMESQNFELERTLRMIDLVHLPILLMGKLRPGDTVLLEAPRQLSNSPDPQRRLLWGLSLAIALAFGGMTIKGRGIAPQATGGETFIFDPPADAQSVLAQGNHDKDSLRSRQGRWLSHVFLF